MPEFRYKAFVSYSWSDAAWGKWLLHEIETYRTPAALIGKAGAHGEVPARLHPLFKDREEEAAGASIGAAVETALASSEFLIVLCSPRSAQSQWVNHEVGLVLPIPEIALLARAAGARLFVDATQALGKLPIAVGALGASAVAFASHKIGGPSGAGALHVSPGVTLDPVALGGGQERGRRAGSPALEALIGFGGAAGSAARAAGPATSRLASSLPASQALPQTW